MIENYSQSWRWAREVELKLRQNAVAETKEGNRFKKAIVLNAKLPYKYFLKEKELVGQLITPGLKKQCFIGKCPLDLVIRRPLVIFARAVSWELLRFG